MHSFVETEVEGVLGVGSAAAERNLKTEERLAENELTIALINENKIPPLRADYSTPVGMTKGVVSTY